jgi:hypothetical protein
VIIPKPDVRPSISKNEALQIVERLTTGLPLVPSNQIGWTMDDLFCIAGAAIAVIQSIPQAGMYSMHKANSNAEDSEVERRCAITVNDLAGAIISAMNDRWDEIGCGERYWVPSPIENQN